MRLDKFLSNENIGSRKAVGTLVRSGAVAVNGQAVRKSDIRIDPENLPDSSVVLQAKMHTSCFYPFINYYIGGELAMSYTVARRHIRLAEFTLQNYL